MILSVHNKASRLAVLGELGRYPIFISALSQCINYKYSLLERQSTGNLIGNMLKEMSEMSKNGADCWLTRVNEMQKNLKMSQNLKSTKFLGKNITKKLKGKFDMFWLKKINEFKNNNSDEFFCILSYSKHIIFSWQSHTFWVTDDFLCDFW